MVLEDQEDSKGIKASLGLYIVGDLLDNLEREE